MVFDKSMLHHLPVVDLKRLFTKNQTTLALTLRFYLHQSKKSRLLGF